MVYACPAESDPRDKLEDFITNPEHRTIAGLRTEGLEKLIELIEEELARIEPDSETVVIDREVLSDNGIDFPKDLSRYFDGKMDAGKRCNFLINDDIPVINWQSAVKGLEGKQAQVFCFSVACRQIPCCSKLV